MLHRTIICSILLQRVNSGHMVFMEHMVNMVHMVDFFVEIGLQHKSKMVRGGQRGFLEKMKIELSPRRQPS